MCKPDSVRIDIPKITALLRLYREETKLEFNLLSWREWGDKRKREKEYRNDTKGRLDRQAAAESKASRRARGTPGRIIGRMSGANAVFVSDPIAPVHGNLKRATAPLSEQQKKQEFWVEVMQPLARPATETSTSKTSKTKRKSTTQAVSLPSPSQDDVNADSGCRRSKRKTQSKRNWAEFAAGISAESTSDEDVPGRMMQKGSDIWHLARPIQRLNKLDVNTSVLCIVPAMALGPTSKSTGSQEDDDYQDEVDNEECFAGYVVEKDDDHVRIRLYGLPKSEDLWMHWKSPKLFLDGGRWTENHESKGVPARHYWQVTDSKRLCLDKNG
jgi:hypothetical protein